jgi:hypothetical protein|nr:MAG TPA: hypothetical protein [Caudoviricetes sp.]
MLQMELLDRDTVYKRVDKRMARKAFDAGRVVHLTTSRAYPGSLVGSYDIKLPLIPDSFDTFDNYVNSFKYYNCSNETGRNVNYFIEK